MKSKKKALTPEEKLSQALLPREEWPYELPKGWVWTRIKYVYQVNPKSKCEDEVEASFVPMQKISAGFNFEFQFDIKSWKDIKKGHPHFEENDVAFAKISPCFENRKSFIAHNLINGIGAGTTELVVLRQPLISSLYTYWLVNSERFISGGVNTYSGTVGQQRINMDYVRNYPVPLPPLPEQQRIVNKIESLFAKLDEAGDRLQKVLDGYEARRAAILHEAFSGKWTGDHGAGDMSVPKGWRKAAIKDICHRLSYGTSKKSLAEGKYIVIRMGNLQNGTIDWSNLAYSNDETEYAKYKLNPGDVLFNRTNSSELVGKTSIYKGEYPAIYAGYLIKLDYDRALINGEYLNYYLNSPRAKLYYNQVKTDGVNQSNISSKKIGNFEIAFPSMEEQNNIVSKLNHIFENDKKSLFLAKESLSKIDLMKKSILARAFRGELGTQDSSDPSALELLKECVLAGKEVTQS